MIAASHCSPPLLCVCVVSCVGLAGGSGGRKLLYVSRVSTQNSWHPPVPRIDLHPHDIKTMLVTFGSKASPPSVSPSVTPTVTPTVSESATPSAVKVTAVDDGDASASKLLAGVCLPHYDTGV